MKGYYTPGPIANPTVHPSKNVTKCSNQTAMFHFDPAQAIQNELKTGINLTDLKWPSEIEDGIQAAKLASNVMFVLYCIGIGAVGLALIGALIGVFASGRFPAMVNTMLSFVSAIIDRPSPSLLIDHLARILLFDACIGNIYRYHRKGHQPGQQARKRDWTGSIPRKDIYGYDVGCYDPSFAHLLGVVCRDNHGKKEAVVCLAEVG